MSFLSRLYVIKSYGPFFVHVVVSLEHNNLNVLSNLLGSTCGILLKFAQQLQAFVWFDVCLRPPNPQQHSLLSVHVELGARLRHMGRQLGVTKLRLERQQNQVQGTIHDM